MKLVSDWGSAWTWTSMHAFAAIGIIQAAWQIVPDAKRAGIPAWVPFAVTMIVVVIGVIGRVRDQTPAKKDLQFE